MESSPNETSDAVSIPVELENQQLSPIEVSIMLLRHEKEIGDIFAVVNKINTDVQELSKAIGITIAILKQMKSEKRIIVP